YLDFSSPAAAIGQTLPVMDREIVGVVPDFQMHSIREPVHPTVYLPGDPAHYLFLSLRIAGDRVPEVLSAVDGLWQRTGDKQRPISRFFFDQYLNDLYAEITRQGQLLTALSSIAVFVAALGLFGLAAFTAERRTKEIGVRKAMGASSRDILRLLVWEFAKPVLLANVIAWPVGYFVMGCWLQGFAYHIDLELWVFAGASMLALAIAVLTVSGYALLVARAEPVSALRYE
ncbi:MAG: ABC transporter permease, partial [Rhodospirillaceae bacterium]